MKKILFAIIFSLTAAGLFAYDAEVLSVQGKAQYSSNGTSWTPIAEGTIISQGATIQTAFKSALKLKFKGSVVDLGPMTRIKLDELSETPAKDNAVVSMKIGTLTSNVKKVEDRRAGFTIKGPAATASVRGTIVKEECGYKQDTVTAIESVTAVWPTSKGEGSAKEVSDTSNSAAAVSGGLAVAGAVALSQGQSTAVGSDGEAKKPYGYANENSVFLGAESNIAFEEAVGGNPFGGLAGGPAGGVANIASRAPTTGAINVTVTMGQ